MFAGAATFILPDSVTCTRTVRRTGTGTQSSLPDEVSIVSTKMHTNKRDDPRVSASNLIAGYPYNLVRIPRYLK